MITVIKRQKQLKYEEFQLWKRPFDDFGGNQWRKENCQQKKQPNTKLNKPTGLDKLD